MNKLLGQWKKCVNVKGGKLEKENLAILAYVFFLK
jgi:hypothetical protein